MQQGNTLAILYPNCELNKGENNEPHIEQTDLERCFVFNASMAEVKHEAHMLMETANDIRKSFEKCFCCGWK